MHDKQTALEEILRRNRLQQKDVAAAVGVTRMAVAGWYHGRSVPSGENLARLLAFLQQFEPGLTLADLLPVEPHQVAPAPALPTPSEVA